MKKALICGASGQDGAFLSRLLLDKGYAVYGASRDAQAQDFRNLKRLGIDNEVELVSMNLTDFRSVLQTLKAIEPDEVYNLAGQSSVGLSFEQPIEAMESISLGSLTLLEAIRMCAWPIRFYNAGSSECFGDTKGTAATEATPFAPCSPYGVAKAAATWQTSIYRSAYDMYCCTGILFNHESYLRPERFVTRKIVCAATRIASGSTETLKLGNIEIRRDWGWAPDYVEAMWLMLQADEPDDYVVATGKDHSLEDFVAAAFDYVGLAWRDHVVTDSALFRPSDIVANRGDPSRARERLGWQPRHDMHGVVRRMMEAEAKA